MRLGPFDLRGANLGLRWASAALRRPLPSRAQGRAIHLPHFVGQDFCLGLRRGGFALTAWGDTAQLGYGKSFCSSSQSGVCD